MVIYSLQHYYIRCLSDYVCPYNNLIIILSYLSVFVICMHVTLIQSPYQQPSVIVSPNSFVHRCQAISVSKIQMSTALNQHLDTFYRKARLHSHRERGLWPTEGR